MKSRNLINASLILVLTLAAAMTALAQSGDVVKASAYVSVDGVRPGDKFTVAVAVDIGDGYHVNANVPSLEFLIPTSLKLDLPDGFQLLSTRYPEPDHKLFSFAPEEMLAVLEGRVYILAEVEADQSLAPGTYDVSARLTVQACNDSQCLGPADIALDISVRSVDVAAAVSPANQEILQAASSAKYAGAPQLQQFAGAQADANKITELIDSYGLAFALGAVFMAGLALNATPCVYPIIPITVGFFMNQGGSGQTRLRRTFFLASMYVLGMAITYSVLGVIAALSKGLFGGALQNPWVLVGLAALMVVLALSMFGAYEFRLPDSLNRFATKSTQSTSGALGALVMGLTMGIVAAPCIGPFVVGLLIHVGAKGDPVYGFFLFFVLALGLGAPYLVLGTFSGSIKSLPRSGEWMVTVRKVFGVALIGLALYFLMPLMGDLTNIVFVVFFAAAAAYLILWEARRVKLRGFSWALRVLGIGAAAAAIFFALPERTEAGISWQPFSEQALAQAKSEGRGVIIDTYADWCIPCKELEKLTFTDAEVRKEAERFVTLKLDLTRNDPTSEAGRARERFEIVGVPTVIFLDPEGNEREDLRLKGFEKPNAFLSRMQEVQFTPVPAAAQPETAPGVSEPAPSASLELLNGGELVIESLRGQVVLLDFWATWCVPCISQIPMFNELHRTYGEQGVKVVAISLDEEGPQKVRAFLRRYPMNYTQVMGNADVAATFGVEESSLPVLLIIDKQGQIRYRHVGVTTKRALEPQLLALLAEE